MGLTLTNLAIYMDQIKQVIAGMWPGQTMDLYLLICLYLEVQLLIWVICLPQCMAELLGFALLEVVSEHKG